MIDLSFLREQPVAVMGLGGSGLVAARALYDSGVAVWAWDDGEAARAKAREAGIPVMDLVAEPLAGLSWLVLAPGIPHTHPVPTRAKAAGVPIIGDVELLLRADHEARLVGITGTNGKSTTTTLTAHMLEAAGRRVAVGGNLGPPALSLERMGAGGTYVLELSSYQLELTPTLACDVAVLLNITPDHLERHGGMDGYIEAKRRIFRLNGHPMTAIVGTDDAICRGIADRLERCGGRTVLRISSSGGLAKGVYAADGELIDAREGAPSRIVSLADLPSLPGSHNAQNAAAAAAVGLTLGLDHATIAEALRSYPGLAHRQELIATIDGVAYVNDSKATNGDATAKALACYRPIYWIAGGRAKAEGLKGLDALMPRVAHAFLVGEAEDEFAAWLDGKAAYTRCGTVEKALAAAAQVAQSERRPGATVLLSPAAASQDQFRDFEQRGELFRGLVGRMAEGRAA